MKKDVYTIGYEGAAVGDFIDTLIEVGIDHVVDIRDVPASRRPGFSKNALRTELTRHGIEYTHLKPLGDPKNGREAMRNGNFDLFQEIFSAHISRECAQEALKFATLLAERERIVLLCFERNQKHCHRTIVAAHMAALSSFQIRHLGVQKRRGISIVKSGETSATVG